MIHSDGRRNARGMIWFERDGPSSIWCTKASIGFGGMGVTSERSVEGSSRWRVRDFFMTGISEKHDIIGRDDKLIGWRRGDR